MAITFVLEGKELEAAKVFIEEHNKKHGNDRSAIGGRYTYMFTSTSLGVAVRVKCACEEKADVTNYDEW